MSMASSRRIVAMIAMLAIPAFAQFATPPQTAKPSLDGTPYADYKAPSPALGAKKPGPRPVVKYRNGKLVEDNTPPVLMVDSEFGGPVNGKLVVPAFVGDVAYLSVTVQTEAQHPLRGKAVSVVSKAGNKPLLMADATDKDGYLEFRMLATTVGRDTVTVEAEGVRTQFVFDVTRPPSGDWLGSMDLKGVTSWDLLMRADLTMGRDQVEARFPADILKLKDTTVRLVGFMLPLQSAAKQTHFLLSANPPACFFHPPGGPSSVTEVFIDKGAKGVETTYDPMVMEGRLELVERSPTGILYRLQGAKRVSKG